MEGWGDKMKVFKSIIKGTGKYFIKLIISFIFLIGLLIIFSSFFHMDLFQKINEILQMRQSIISNDGIDSVFLSIPILLTIFLIPQLFLLGMEIYNEYHKGELI